MGNCIPQVRAHRVAGVAALDPPSRSGPVSCVGWIDWRERRSFQPMSHTLEPAARLTNNLHSHLHQTRLTKKNLISLRGGISSTGSDGCGSATSTILIPSPNTSSCAGAYLPSCMGQSPGDVITKAAQSPSKEKERQRRERGGGTEGGGGKEGGGKAGGESATAWKKWGLVRPRKEKITTHYKLGKKVRRREGGRKGEGNRRGGRGI